MARLPRLLDLDERSSGWGFFLCARKDVRTGRGGDTIFLVLQDASGQRAARVLSQGDGVRDEFEAGEFVKVEGHASRQPRGLELAVERIRRVYPEQDRLDGFREEDCVPSAPRPIDDMWNELRARVDRVANPWVQQLLAAIMDRHGERLRTWPAAVTVHHAYRGGLLEHVLAIADSGERLARVYGADADLLLAGAILHDVGKLEELTYDGVASYSRAGNLIGHITIGVVMVREAAAGITGFPEDLRDRIEHLVVSHHGERELGSPVEPMTEEAFILSALDDLDARLHQFRRHVREDEGGGEFTRYHTRLGRVLLKPGGR
jgi:3'-5' exoribonuclease